MADPLVTVVIVSWNTRDLLRRCLASFEGSGADIWVVDNASSDGSAEMVREEFPSVRVEALAENVGFGRAANLAAARARTPWIAIANADVAVRPGALEALVAAGEADPKAGALAPRLILPDGSTQHSVFSFPTVGNALVVSTGIGRLIPALGRRVLLLGAFDADRPQLVPWAVAAFLLIRREAWAGFDEQQWMYAEDLDLGWRLREAGWHTRYVPEALVDHESGAAAQQAFGDSGRTERWQHETYAWMERRMGRGRTRTVAAIHVAGQAVRLAALAPLARVAPGRFARRRDAARWWLGMHRRR